MKAMLIGAVLGAAGLSGCASPSADIHALNSGAGLPGARTYAFARPLSQRGADADGATGAQRPPYEALLRDELARYGLTMATAVPPAHYRVSVAYDTRPAEVRVNPAHCPDGACGPSGRAPAPAFALFGGPVFQHSLTLRFFESASGQEVYAVSAVSSDRDADPVDALPLLVKSAMAKFPFGAPADWRVTLRAASAGGVPEVVSVKPVPR